ncbi:MAG: type II toxin-antitoxin system HicB family antitoxin [Microcystis aeruginosa WS75]|nr:type II toxin-antitoxin system HicB family antitoxin [Microcystis aeruginosa WS75]
MKTSNTTKLESLEFYFGLKYPITIYPDDQGGYVSEIKHLPGCFTQGETIEETLISKQ